MNLIQLVLALYLFNILFLFFLIYLTSELRNLKIISIGTPFLIPLTAWLGMFLQSTFNIDDISSRQMLANVLLTLWAFKFSAYNKNFKLLILRHFLNKEFQLKGLNLYKKIKNIFFFINCLMVSLMPVISLNFLSGNLSLGLLDISAVLIFLLGFGYEVKALTELKKSSFKQDDKVHREGLWLFSRHPDLFGQLVAWWGLYILALGAVGGEWSIFGPMLVTFLYLKFFVKNIEGKLSKKYNDYEEYKVTTPSIFPKITSFKS